MTNNRSSDRETLRIIDRALWVDHGTGSLDALTPELPIWADEWAERIVAAVNGRRVITDPAELDALPELSIVLTHNTIGWQMTDRDYDGGAIWEAGTAGESSAQLLGHGPVTVLWTPENGDTDGQH
ncbi:hypothetical protein [Nocardia abscessus]|uniref:hypothetical protein n=1 Tax=Nocardia abscessus TaxID=120957 RepID=UPI0002D6F95B|nr:hypothetical protein [Nocardia abscessus]MCC3333556.1 hypothetical protein [Nocardia abscessus]